MKIFLSVRVIMKSGPGAAWLLKTMAVCQAFAQPYTRLKNQSFDFQAYTVFSRQALTMG